MIFNCNTVGTWFGLQYPQIRLSLDISSLYPAMIKKYIPQLEIAVKVFDCDPKADKIPEVVSTTHLVTGSDWIFISASSKAPLLSTVVYLLYSVNSVVTVKPAKIGISVYPLHLWQLRYFCHSTGKLEYRVSSQLLTVSQLRYKNSSIGLTSGIPARVCSHL